MQSLNHNNISGSSDVSLKQDSVVLRSTDPAESVLFTFIVDGISEGNESFSLNLVPLASTLQTMPNGEAVYFLSSLELTIMDADGKSSLSFVTLNFYFESRLLCD